MSLFNGLSVEKQLNLHWREPRCVIPQIAFRASAAQASTATRNYTLKLHVKEALFAIERN
jgi:hypothetical protein